MSITNRPDPTGQTPQTPIGRRPGNEQPLTALLPLYAVVFAGFVGYSLMITVFTPMILHNDNGMLAASSTTSERTIILGVLLSLYPAGQFFGAPVLGALSDRVGRRPVLLASLGAGCLGYALIAAAVDMQSLWLLCVASFFGGLTEANISIAQSSIADTASPADRNRLFGYVYLSASMAYVIGPLVGGQLANSNLVNWFHYQTPFIAAGILVFLTLVAMFLWFPESRRSGAEGPGYLKSFTNLSGVFTDKRLRSLYLVNFLLYLAIFGFFRAYPMYLVDAFHLQVSRESAFVAHLFLGGKEEIIETGFHAAHAVALVARVAVKSDECLGDGLANVRARARRSREKLLQRGG